VVELFKGRRSFFFKIALLAGFALSCTSCHWFQNRGGKLVNGMKFNSFTLDNNLQVLTISDDRFVKSSAALAVLAGSMENPDEHLGLAHFLEHLLFLGTKEFPEVGEYEDFLNRNGGGHNAYTSIDHTNYFFDVNHVGFEDSLNRFSRFFVSPTFDPKYVDREKNAVNSEHEKNRKDDGRREYRIQQLMSDPNHPFSKFSTGDKNTLSKAGRDEVMAFYKKFYSANLMRLVLMSNQSPDELKAMAQKYFADVPDRNLKGPEYAQNVFPDKGLPRMAEVKTIRDRDMLKVSFSIPDELDYWKSKPAQLLSHLIGDEGEGSLLSYLKEKGWVLSLNTSTWWRTFHIKMTLSESGKGKVSEIIKAIFSYVNLLKTKGLEKHVFEERQILSKIELSNIEPKSSMGRASDFSSSLLYYPVDEFLERHYLFHDYSQEDFRHFLSFLTIENMQITRLARDAKTDKVEKYYGAEYAIRELTPETIQSMTTNEVYPELSLPPPNPYTPKNLEMVSHGKINKPEKSLYKDKAVIYTQTDTDLEIPKASLVLSFVSDIIKGDPRKYLAAQLFAIAKRQELNEWGYPARLAGLNYSVGHGNNTITVEASGYTEHLPELMKALIFDPKNKRKLSTVKLQKDLFARIKRKYKKSLLNADFDAAYQSLLYENSHFFTTGGVHRDKYKDLVDQMTLEELNAFGAEFFRKVAIRAYAYGNIEKSIVNPPLEYFLENITDKTFSEAEVETFESKYLQYPEEEHALVFGGKNNNNAELNIYKMSAWTIRDQALVEIFSKVLEQPFFTELRTNQQLGYVVAAFGASSNGFCGLGTLIQSQTNSPVQIHDKAEVFFKKLIVDFSKSLTDEDIAPIKAAIINQVESQPNTLNERLSRFMNLAGTYYGDFDFYEKYVKAVKAATAEDVKAYLKTHYLEDTTKSKLALFYFGTDSKRESLPGGLTEIKDVDAFKAKMPKIQPYKQRDGDAK